MRPADVDQGGRRDRSVLVESLNQRRTLVVGLKVWVHRLSTVHAFKPGTAGLGMSPTAGCPAHREYSRHRWVVLAMMTGMDRVEVLVAHSERATLRVGNVFVKIDADQTRADLEVEAMGRAPVPTAEILWRQPPALALAALPGGALGHLGEPSLASSQAWVAAGAAVRTLHDAPLPPWPGRSVDELATRLDADASGSSRTMCSPPTRSLDE